MTDQIPLSIGLHVGVHKTATTHLQRSVATVPATQALDEAGVRFCGPRQFRWGAPSLFTRFGIPVRPHGKRAAADPAALDALCGDARRLVLSEENFIGTPGNRRGALHRPLYPDAARRVAALAARTGPLDLFVAIRQPSTWANSTFAQMLQGGTVVPVEQFILRNPLTGVDWVDLVDRLRGAAGVRSLTLWRYEDYRALFPQICTAMLGPVGARLRPLAGQAHPGMSAAAAQAILAGGALAPDAVEAMARYPLSADHPKLDIYDAETHALSAEDYALQLARIDAMDGVVRLRPDAA